ncbi:ferric-rhodotorulic acid/ferric-coprogen receptor FhuE [Alteromonas sp. KC14]|uniref:TonB-dependent siderophore receptor n=1 Tax=unclassified Alteromonas TaxID=2614992 RepID=UPI001923DA99|nr:MULTISPECIES: TonB-dependent siderophore receptor [unclassified Alteromonas]BCO21235.1 ferric-rhodotorulic acid/ferric-coprogen receptor FhuE [Alteromonas sp. KC14]
MKRLSLFALSPLALAFSVHAQDVSNDTQAAQDIDVEEIRIVGVRQNRVSRGATGLSMEISETPQSISILSEDLMQSFGAFNINDALKLAPGINVEEWETNRTNYTARGFEIKNTQIDGVGLPNDWGIVTGAVDAYGYEKIEIIRGANGLLTGVGNASGTINYVRKRPTNETGGEVGASFGSFDFKRAQADYSVLLTEDGRWAARVVGSIEDKEGHIDGLKNDRTFLYGVVDGQLTDNATVTFGLSHQDANTDGNTWGGLVFNYTDGTQAEWDVSDTTTQEWTKWDTQTTNAFAELDYVFDNDWQLLLSYNYRGFEDQSKLFYAYGAIDKETGLGLTGWPGRYDSERDSHLVEGRLFGEYALFGREHEFNVGVSHATSDDVSFVHAFDYATTPAFGPTPAFPYGLDAIAEPEWLVQSEYSNIEQTLTRYFGSTKIAVNDALFVIAGFNAIDFERSGENAGAVIDNEEREISPYVGATYAVTDRVNAYVSYSDVYQPQEQYDINGQYLAPTKGKNFETGFKAQWFDDRLLTTFAYFTAKQNNLAAYAGTNPDTLMYYYKGVSVESTGFEFEVAGQITEALRANASYTNIDVEDEQGNDANLWAPRDVVTFQLGYTVPQAPEIELGVGGRWQSEISNVDYNVKQGAYFLGNVYASQAFTDNLTVRMNINNIFDKKYINSLHTIGFYGAGINAQLSAVYTF